MPIITIKSTYFESSYFHLLNVHADTDEYLAGDFSMAHSCWKLNKYIWNMNFPLPSPHPHPSSCCLIVSCFTGLHICTECLWWQRKLWVLSDPSSRVSGGENMSYSVQCQLPRLFSPNAKEKLHQFEQTLLVYSREVHKARDRTCEPFLTLV